MECEWDESNILHLTAHGVSTDEAEEALDDPKRKGASVYNVGVETRYGRIGATETGRVLFVVFIRRQGKARVVTARNATNAEGRRYHE